jgi:FKBP-type peptidyl-prolyl cis-trans isomerase SlyD
MENIKEGDFIQIEFTGRVKSDNYIFDTTSKQVAQENGLYNPQINYGPVTICIGKSMVLEGLDNALKGKELGFDGTVEIAPERAFGKKNPKLLKLIPTNKFKQSNINPQPGLQVNVDGSVGFVKTVTGGRTIVDFNHPLSGKILLYDVKVLNKVDDTKEQISSVLTMKLNMKKDNYTIDVQDNTCSITLKGLPEMPEDVNKTIVKFIKEIVAVDAVTITSEASDEKKE